MFSSIAIVFKGTDDDPLAKHRQGHRARVARNLGETNARHADNLPVYAGVTVIREDRLTLSRVSSSNSETIQRYSPAIAVDPGELAFDQYVAASQRCSPLPNA